MVCGEQRINRLVKFINQCVHCCLITCDKYIGVVNDPLVIVGLIVTGILKRIKCTVQRAKPAGKVGNHLSILDFIKNSIRAIGREMDKT